MKLGASFSALKSALEKLSQGEEMPEYLKSKTKPAKKKNLISKLFSTHPELADRISSLEHKIAKGLPFNYYLSTPQKIRSSLGFFLQWKVSVPLAGSFAVFTLWASLAVKEGGRLVTFIKVQNPQAILEHQQIAQKINSKPYLIGKSLMSYVIQKQNPELINYYLERGADPGRTLIYLAETKNFDLFQGYYTQLSHKLSQDEYYLVLLRSADINFTQGFRYLVNASRFDSLNPDYKAELARNHKPQTSDRRPASKE